MTDMQTYVNAIRLPLPPGHEDPVTRARSYCPDLADAIQDVYGSVTLRRNLDPVTTELVRLRAARALNCRLCQSVRLAAAVQAGLDEVQAAKIDAYEASDLSERHKAALRLADAFIYDPASVGSELIAELETWFSRDERMELILDLTAWLTIKILVPVRLDIPADLEGTALLRYDAAGNPVVEAAVALSVSER
jgi:AhpD family alkylhydroperoxidase